MRSSTIFVLPFAALALAASSDSSVPYSNTETNFLPQTNSLGVVTGQPLPVTTQPSVVTSQPSVATSPAGTPSGITVVTSAAPPLGTAGSSAHAGASSAGGAGSGHNSTVSTHKPTATSSGRTSGSATGSSTASGSAAASSGAAAFLQPAVGLGFVGALFAALI